MDIDEVCEVISDIRREDRRCAQLLYFCNRVAGLYQIYTGKNFHYLRQLERMQKSGNIFSEAVKEIKETCENKPCGEHEPCIDDNIDASRRWNEMSLADIDAFSKCLKYSLRDEFILVRYEENEIWGNSAFRQVKDIWSIYHGLLQECRSSVINLDTMEYVLLPFAKFRNLNESPEYSVEAVQDKIAKARTVEFSEKIDGSFMQMRYLGDNRFQDGIIVSSSGSLDPGKSRQLADVISFLKTKNTEITRSAKTTDTAETAEEPGDTAENPGRTATAKTADNIKRMVTECPDITFIFEWIGDNDPHVVSYPEEMKGLHLVGMRDVENGYQYSYQEVIATAEEYGVPTTSLHNSLTLSEVLEQVKRMNGNEHEGFVLNVDGFLVKIKSPDFLKLMRSVDLSQSFNVIVKYTAEGKIDDFISMLPTGFQADARQKLRKLMGYVNDVSKRVEEEYQKLPLGSGMSNENYGEEGCMPPDRKTVMLAINEIKNKTIQDLVRAKYLGKPLEIIAATKKNGTIQYIKEADIDAYYRRSNNKASDV